MSQGIESPVAPERDSLLRRFRLPSSALGERAAVMPREIAAPDWARRLVHRRRSTDFVSIVLALSAVPVVGQYAPGFLPQPAIGELVVAAGLSLAWFLALRIGRIPELRAAGMDDGEFRGLLVATAAVFGAFAVASVVADIASARGYLVVGLPLGLAALVGTRTFWRRSLRVARESGLALTRALVVGSRSDVDAATARLARTRDRRYVVAGAVVRDVEDDREDRSASTLRDIADSVAESGADAVLLATLPGDGGTFLRDLCWRLESTGADLVIATPMEHVAPSRLRFSPIEGMPLLHVGIPRFGNGAPRVKRLLDLVLSGCALLVLAPVLAVIATLVRLDSPGPALFRQLRVGRAGREFTMYKFRSMVTDAESRLGALAGVNEGSGVLFKIRRDPRVTRLGAVLRRYSLDELPQLWNVLVGDMSLVGPRPPLPSEVERYEDHIRRRLYVLPGLTGAWQVSGRSDLTWEESVRIDLYYVENWSLIRDLVILARTVRVVLLPFGAY